MFLLDWYAEEYQPSLGPPVLQALRSTAARHLMHLAGAMILPNLLLVLATLFALVSTATAEPVHAWREPGMQVNASPAGLMLRGHVSSPRQAENLRSLAGKQPQTEFWRHIVLPDYWQEVSSAIVLLAGELQSGAVALSRDGVQVAGLVENQAEFDAAIEKLVQDLPPSLPITIDVHTLSDEQRRVSCIDLRNVLPTPVILFARNSSDIRGGYVPDLNRIANFLRRCPGYTLIATGHADALGTPRSSRVVSDRRARAVTDYLRSIGVAAERLTAVGKGKSMPVATNETWEGRNLNRRTEIRLYSESVASEGP